MFSSRATGEGKRERKQKVVGYFCGYCCVLEMRDVWDFDYLFVYLYTFSCLSKNGIVKPILLQRCLGPRGYFENKDLVKYIHYRPLIIGWKNAIFAKPFALVLRPL